MNHPRVSILMLTHDAPEFVAMTIDGVATTILTRYELIVVDNASGPETRAVLEARRDKIDKLVLSDENLLFGAGNNRAFEEVDPEAKYILLLNSDVEIRHPLWLSVLVEWAEWLPQTYIPNGSFNPAQPKPGPRDIVSFGWCPRPTRPDGWCLLMRRELYAKYGGIDAERFPWYYGIEWLIAQAVRDGARAGVLANMSKYIHHLGSKSPRPTGLKSCIPETTAAQWEWYNGLDIETLTFTLRWPTAEEVSQIEELIIDGATDRTISERLTVAEKLVSWIRNGHGVLGPGLVPGSGIRY